MVGYVSGEAVFHLQYTLDMLEKVTIVSKT